MCEICLSLIWTSKFVVKPVVPVPTDFSNKIVWQRFFLIDAEKVVCKSLLTQCPPNEAEEQSEANEGPVPFMVFPHCRHSHEHKNQGLTDAA